MRGDDDIRKDEKTRRVWPANDPERVEKTYFRLKKKGVQFTEELTDWGKYALLEDPDGHELEIS